MSKFGYEMKEMSYEEYFERRSGFPFAHYFLQLEIYRSNNGENFGLILKAPKLQDRGFLFKIDSNTKHILNGLRGCIDEMEREIDSINERCIDE
jgi:hypothetical protein